MRAAALLAFLAVAAAEEPPLRWGADLDAALAEAAGEALRRIEE